MHHILCQYPWGFALNYNINHVINNTISHACIHKRFKKLNNKATQPVSGVIFITYARNNMISWAQHIIVTLKKSLNIKLVKKT